MYFVSNVTIPEPLNEFSRNLGLGSFTKIGLYILTLVKIGQ